MNQGLITMHIPKHFEETSIDAIRGLIRSHPLATLVTYSSDGLNANHIPLLYIDSLAPSGSLHGHLPRANPLGSREMGGVDALAIFQGPNAYISPTWYATKQETGKVVPTWNYTVVHAYGRLRIIDDPEWVRAQVETLTNEHERQFKEPWKVSDAPRSYTDRLIQGLVGVEIEITRLLGKKKASQNQPHANRVGVAEGLKSLDRVDAIELASVAKSDAE